MSRSTAVLKTSWMNLTKSKVKVSPALMTKLRHRIKVLGEPIKSLIFITTNNFIAKTIRPNI
jgi:hypothetical protein